MRSSTIPGKGPTTDPHTPGAPAAGVPLRLTTGEPLPVLRGDYDAARSLRTRQWMQRTGFSAVCHAPFTTLMFDQDGMVRLCNHAYIPFAQVDEQFSILETWRSTPLQQLREDFVDYRLNPSTCRMCVRQLTSEEVVNSFPLIQFDRIHPQGPRPDCPKHLIFYLNNSCNLACIMCSGRLSSRIRKEIEGLPPLRSPYGERFFSELEQILPHVEYIEFYGGEPFLSRDHMRIFGMLERMGSTVPLFVNTNTTTFHPQARRLLETLNFVTVAISMDALHPELHSEIRYGLDSRQFMENVDYLRSLRRLRRRVRDGRPPLHLMLNVTEHRKNWFDLPNLFRFAEQRSIALHINTCIVPTHVTLYTLPTPELQYVLGYFARQLEELRADLPGFTNADAYSFLMGLVRGELTQRQAGAGSEGASLEPLPGLPPWRDGMLGVPILGYPPFETREQFEAELTHMSGLSPSTLQYFARGMRQQATVTSRPSYWAAALDRLDRLAAT